MAKIEIYTTELCGYCYRAKRLLDSENLAYDEIDVSASRDLRSAMTKRAGGRTSVPQIFIDDMHIGGSDELAALHRSGNLAKLVGGLTE